MEILSGHLEIVVIFLGALLGSTKARLELDKDKKCIHQFFDIVLGLFIGTMCAYHFGTQYSVWMTGLIAVIGGATGALVVEVVLRMVPSFVKTALKLWVSKL